MVVRYGGDVEEETLIEQIRIKIIRARDSSVAALAWQISLMKTVEAAIEAWADDSKPDIRGVIAAVYRVRAFRRMLRNIGTKPKRKKKR